ncbi:sugar phosphate isomerase/epimerase family protein [Paenibacillus sp. strain BS8-2]
MEVHQSWWAISEPKDDSVLIEKKLVRAAEAGFAGILSRLPERGKDNDWARLLRKYGLQWGVQSFPISSETYLPMLERCQALGVQYANAQVANSFVTGDSAIQLLDELVKSSARVGIPMFVETHRGKITQDLLRTLLYLEALPELRLTLDLSHYVLAGEMTMEEDISVADQRFQSLFMRSSCIHGRISNGQQIQLAIEEAGDDPCSARFVLWWSQCMQNWMKEAVPGDVLPFVCELGPPPYAMTSGDAELSDRWKQALILKKMAEQAWAMAAAAEHEADKQGSS